MRNIINILFVALLMLLLSNTHVNAQDGNMKYLVKGEFVDPGPLMSPEQAKNMIEKVIIPSLDLLAKWEEQGKISGGLPLGARSGAFVMEATSRAEVDKMLQSLPFWGLLSWDVTALHSFKGRADQEREAMKAMSVKN